MEAFPFLTRKVIESVGKLGRESKERAEMRDWGARLSLHMAVK